MTATLSHSPIPIADDPNDDIDISQYQVPQPPEALIPRFRRRLRSQLNDDFEFTDGDQSQTLAVNSRIPIAGRRREEVSNAPDIGVAIPNYDSIYGWSQESEDRNQQGADILSHFEDRAWFNRNSEQDNNPIDSGGRSSRRGGLAQRTSSLYTYLFGRNTNPTRSVNSVSPSEGLPPSARRGPRFSRSRPPQAFILDRERSGEEREDRERLTPSLTQRPNRYSPNAIQDVHRNVTHNDLRIRVNAHRRLYSENPPSVFLKETIRYLERVRFSHTQEESFLSAIDRQHIPIASKSDFLNDTASIRTPTDCSWLRCGSMFTGSQRAAHTLGSQMLSHRLSDSGQGSDPANVNGGETGRISVSTTSGRRYWAASNGHPIDRSGKEEKWPVKVTIHDIDFSNMTLAGTMEAYNIPDKTNLNQDAHIITFLEGEIIDFNRYTLQTQSFRADVEIDCTYWRELQPFKAMTDDQMAKKLMNRKWVTEELMGDWILMRWKGEY